MSCVTDWPRMEALILAALSTCTMAGACSCCCCCCKCGGAADEALRGCASALDAAPFSVARMRTCRSTTPPAPPMPPLRGGPGLPAGDLARASHPLVEAAMLFQAPAMLLTLRPSASTLTAAFGFSAGRTWSWGAGATERKRGCGTVFLAPGAKVCCGGTAAAGLCMRAKPSRMRLARSPICRGGPTDGFPGPAKPPAVANGACAPPGVAPVDLFLDIAAVRACMFSRSEADNRSPNVAGAAGATEEAVSKKAAQALRSALASDAS
mmetsp:Transcript_31153/g.89902  ORF Transcript_31153/g.89902 Transcript_31153/m.89902 type:complete len:266 (+) Transcript_31153:185-982(+)|eukprot:CAMPEP_0177221656 /NCGR_PEP_ID=MMETSP0367-20130122/37533_1 /TAXON_ID=447022 ORGANISM="Scrippsiella hangoei-like, Strain SHHI-4" /NCGR_SAMPLE_ID=MMETSP0367 /ASSEMBLY_ACC=CAM_ASM_000362 /LENGTH=265 /DNA_ID=CAMNT_0018671505 /DNA_START=160 /DNA_END=957 /DNA_ORIENTATION=+